MFWKSAAVFIFKLLIESFIHYFAGSNGQTIKISWIMKSSGQSQTLNTNTHSDSPCHPDLPSAAGQRAALAGLRPLRGLQVVCAHSGEGDLGGELRLSDQDPALRRDEVKSTSAVHSPAAHIN